MGTESLPGRCSLYGKVLMDHGYCINSQAMFSGSISHRMDKSFSIIVETKYEKEGDVRMIWWRLLSALGQELTCQKCHVSFIAKSLVHCRYLLNITSKERTVAFRLNLWFWYWPTIWPVFMHLILSFLISKTEPSILDSVGHFTEWIKSCKPLAWLHNASWVVSAQ